MRSTFRIDDDLLERLKKRAFEENTSVSKLLNILLRQGLSTKRIRPAKFRQKVFNLGAPTVNLDKALSMASEDEDLEVLRKLQLRK